MSSKIFLRSNSGVWGGGALHYEQFTFPDGQPHVKVSVGNYGKSVNVKSSICSPEDLFNILLVKDALNRGGTPEVHLTIYYLMGARMDRAIPSEEVALPIGRVHNPFTLKVVCDLLKTGGFSSISIFDPHSDVAVALLEAKVIPPTYFVEQTIKDISNTEAKDDLLLVAPDAGAAKKVADLSIEFSIPMIQGFKHRDMKTGKLSGFGISDPAAVSGKVCLIVDDICDGGGTFKGLASVLRAADAAKVFLYVSHGVFSQGTPLVGIDHIWTTDSFTSKYALCGVTVFEFIK